MLISPLFFSFPQRRPSHRQGSARGAGKWSILSYHSARSTHPPRPGRRHFPRSPARSVPEAHGRADTAPAAPEEPLPLLGRAVMEIQRSCPTVSLPGAQHGSYLLIAECLLQLEFRRALQGQHPTPGCTLCPPAPQRARGLRHLLQAPGSSWAWAFLASQLDVSVSSAPLWNSTGKPTLESSFKPGGLLSDWHLLS